MHVIEEYASAVGSLASIPRHRFCSLISWLELRLHSRVGGRHDLLGYGAWMYIDEKGIRWIVGAYAPD
jgi:hypothetical protein